MSGPMGANFYRDEDAPEYVLGHCLEMMMIALGLCTVLTLRLCYKRINKKRDAALNVGTGAGGLLDEELSDLGDRAVTFRYHL
jgi:hypothetical protein